MVVSNGEAAVIETLRMTEVFEKFAKEHNAVIKHTLDTHLHADHISQLTGAKYWLPPKDENEVVFNYNKLDENAEITV
ncbi:glyoxylase-like metal-dependent hydrolase (beta-lactamase superfamily II) [Bacillus sp. 3255]|nr:glyoxylase-like metal-dependent hydrolase (beta-lactamase superfamily II) [Bacillus sp. 3255]